MFGHLLVGGKIWHKPACLERLNGRIKGKLSPSCFFVPQLCRHFIKGALSSPGSSGFRQSLRVWSTSSCSNSWSMDRTHCFSHLGSVKDTFHVISPHYGLSGTGKSTSSESNSTIQDPLFNCSKSLLGSLLICFCLQYFSHQPGQIYYNYFFPPARKESFRMMLHILWPVDTIDAKKL